MHDLLLIVHMIIVVAMIAVIVLLQRSEGGALGIGGGGGGGLMTGRSAGNTITRVTAILAAGFFLTSLALGILAARNVQPTSILDTVGPAGTLPDGGSATGTLDTIPGTQPEPAATETPATPAAPAAPTGQ